MSATATLSVGVVVERRQPVTAWIEAIWLPVAVLAGVPQAPAWTRLGPSAHGERFFAGSFPLDLHRTDTALYRDNLATGAPRVWVCARLTGSEPPLAIAGVTADPAEGEAWTEAGDDIVESVPMPAALAAAVAEFVALHHVERPFVKRQRKQWSEDDDDA